MRLTDIKLFKIRGGVHPNENKHSTAGSKIRPVPVASRLFIPLQQHIGAPAEPIVKHGAKVLKGQLLANSQGAISAPVHAPTSGKVIAVGKHPAPHPSGLPVRTIIIEPDGDECWGDFSEACHDPFSLDPDEIASRVATAGIVGMGGATFPSAVKLALRKRYKLKQLVINAAECEPYLTCDDQLMREHADEIVAGISIMMYALQVTSATVAIEANKPEAIQAMTQACGQVSDINVITLPVQYPMGSEKHLIQTLTGMETPARALTADIGIVVHNVATAHAIQQCIVHGRPLIDRVVTVSGGAIKNPGNYLTPLGTQVSVLIEVAGGFITEPACIIGGGPMMGQPLPGTSVPIVKGNGGILALTNAETAQKKTMPCIRCGSCVTACPCGLLPLEMANRARSNDLDGAVKFGLTDCIACGSCSYVCPSHIPLVQYFNYAKGALTEQQRTQYKREETRRLTETRNIRMEAIAEAKRAAMAKRKAEMAAKKAQEAKASNAEEARP
jgi:electron transport complex protein RnfC